MQELISIEIFNYNSFHGVIVPDFEITWEVSPSILITVVAQDRVIKLFDFKVREIDLAAFLKLFDCCLIKAYWVIVSGHLGY